MFNLKRSTAEASVVAVRVRCFNKNIWQEIMCCFRTGTSWAREKFQAASTRQDLCRSLRVIFKFSDERADEGVLQGLVAKHFPFEQLGLQAFIASG